MTVKLRIEKDDLPETFRVETRFIEVPDDRCQEDEKKFGECSYCYGAGCNYVNRELWVKFPRLGWLKSHHDYRILLEKEEQIIQELEEHNVPYVVLE